MQQYQLQNAKEFHQGDTFSRPNMFLQGSRDKVGGQEISGGGLGPSPKIEEEDGVKEETQVGVEAAASRTVQLSCANSNPLILRLKPRKQILL